MKKALSLILAIIMVVGLIPTTTIGVFAVENSVEQGSTQSTIPDGAIAISTAEELLAIDGTESGKYYYLTKSIDLGTGEGESYAVTTYNLPQITLNNSTLDGRGLSITGFKLTGNSTDHADVSLFAMTGNVTVKNLTFGAENATIKFDVNDTWNTFSVVMANVPKSTVCTMENVVVYTDMTSNTNGNGRYLGAIAGKVEGTLSLTDCKVYGTVTDKSANNPSGCGGFVGGSTNTATLSFTDCVNNANISGYKKLGGFIGYSCAATVSFEGCTNNGAITSSANALVGGFIGQYYDNTATANDYDFENCTNNGTVSGTDAIGGLVGEWNSKAKANKGTLTVTGFNQSGAVKATNGIAGGIIGKFPSNDDLIVNDLKSDDTGSVEATSYAGGIFGYSSDVPSAGVTVTVNGGSSANSITSTNNHAGGVVGYAAVLVTYNIYNYTNKGTVTTTAASMNAGGLFGQLKTVKPLTINGFTNAGNIVSKNNGAAMIGQYEPTAKVEISNSRNTATVTAQSGSAGMIVGWGSGTGDVTVEDCVNSGAMNGAVRAGGFFGGMTSNKLTVTDVQNYGTITGSGNHAGGFAGDYTVKSTASFDGFANYAAVTSNGTSSNAGGLIGQVTFYDTATISNLSNYAQVISKKNAGAAFGFLSIAKSKKLTVNDLLNMADITVNNSGRSAAVFGCGNGSNGTDAATVTSVELNRVINFGAMKGGVWNGGTMFGFFEQGIIIVNNCISTGTFANGGNDFAIGDVTHAAEENLTKSGVLQATNNYYFGMTPTAGCENGATALADLDAALVLLNTDTYSVWKGFKASDVDTNGKATGIVLATPVLYGVQTGKTVTDGKTSLRFVGTIQNTLRYSEIGITVSLNGIPQTKNSTYVYEHLTAVGADDNVIKYSAADMGGAYAFALTLKDVPVTGTYVFTVKPYAIDTDGTRYDNATAYDVTFKDGVVISVAVSK